MALRANKFLLGLFFIVMLVLFFGAIVWLVGGFSKRASTNFVCYYGWSVGGLNIGSPVNYNGVPVGSVTDISIAPDGRLVEVRLQIIDDKFRVDSTIVASLYITGITGLRNINLESLPDSVLRLNTAEELSFVPPARVIPVRSGTVQSVTSGINRMLEILNSVDVKELNDQAILALTRINNLLDNMAADSVGGRLVTTMDNVDRLVDTYDRLGNQLSVLTLNVSDDVSPLTEDIRRFLAAATNLTNSIGYTADDLEASFNNTEVILSEISVMLPMINRILEGLSSGSDGEDVWR